MAFIFNNAGDYIRRTENIPAANAVSMAGWFKLTTLSGDGWRWLLALGNSASASTADLGILQFLASVPGTAWLRSGTSATELSTSMPNGVWIYAAFSNAGSGSTDLKGYIWNANGSLFTTVSREGQAVGFGAASMGVGALPGGGVGYTDLKCAYIRVWDRVLTQADLEDERFSPTVVDATNINTALGTSSSDDTTGNARHWTFNSIDITSDDEPPVTTTTKYLKYFIQSTAVAAEANGAVWHPGSGGAITGAKIGEFTGIEVVAGTGDDTGKGVLLVPAADFNGSSLAVDDPVVALARTSTFTTGIEPGVIVVE